MSPSPKPPSILLVDDESSLRELISVMLEQGGYRVTAAADGRAAEKLLEQEVFDLVITDVVMPEKDGMEFLTALRRKQLGVRIIAMSGGGLVSATDYLRIARSLGAHSVLKKPFGQDQLLAAVTGALSVDPMAPAT